MSATRSQTCRRAGSSRFWPRECLGRGTGADWRSDFDACVAPDEGSATAGDYLSKLVGLALSAAAAALGAPFWFDALNRLGSLRNTGPKPDTTAH